MLLEYPLGVNKAFANMSYASLEHYWCCAKLFIRLRCALEDRTAGYEYWEKKDYRALINTGIMLCDVAYTILRIRDNQRFLVVMKKAADFIPSEPYPNMKGRMNSYLLKRLEEIDLSEFFPARNGDHNALRDHVGTRFLRELGCSFVAKEAILEKESKELNKKGLRLDLYGWGNDFSIVGIEVKTRMSDFDDALTVERFGRYLDYCSKFFILTANREVFTAAKHWCSCHKDTGAIFYDRAKPDELEIYTSKETTRKVTERMLQKAREIFAAKTKKLIGETFFGPSVCTPDAAMEQIIHNLSKEMLFSGDAVGLLDY